jgi:hypothetical protein
VEQKLKKIKKEGTRKVTEGRRKDKSNKREIR